MNYGNETVQSIHARLKVLKQSLVSEKNSVQYYQTLLDKTPADSEERLGERRMYEDLKQEETKHVQWIQDQILHWERQLKMLEP